MFFRVGICLIVAIFKVFLVKYFFFKVFLGELSVKSAVDTNLKRKNFNTLMIKIFKY